MASQAAELKWLKGLPALINVDGFRFTSRIPTACSSEARRQRRALLEARRGRPFPSPVLDVPGPFFWLTHFHGDHTTGLSSSFGAVVHATPVTAALLVRKLGLPESRVRVVPISVPGAVRPFRLCDGIEAIVLDAQHCPGAGMPVFRCRETGACVLHCGDMRAGDEAVTEWCAVLREWGVRVRGDGPVPPMPPAGAACDRVSLVYLDSTYLSPSAGGRGKTWAFPSQPAVLECLASLVRREAGAGAAAAGRKGGEGGGEGGTPAGRGGKTVGDAGPLFVVGTYQIGQERAAEAVAAACGSRVVVLDDEKAAVVSACGLPRTGRYCRRLSRADRVVLAPLAAVRPELLEGWLDRPAVRAIGFSRVVGLRLTGWTLTAMQRSGTLLSPAAQLRRAARRPAVSPSGRASVVSLPYSEHSSGPELVAFARAIAPLDVVFTVNAETPAQRRSLREQLRGSLPWLGAGRHTLEAAMRRAPPATSAASAAPARPCGEALGNPDAVGVSAGGVVASGRVGQGSSAGEARSGGDGDSDGDVVILDDADAEANAGAGEGARGPAARGSRPRKRPLTGLERFLKRPRPSTT